MQNLSQILQAAYHETPDLPILRLLHSGQPDRTVTYRELLHHAGGYARLLHAAGVQPNQVVILIQEHGLDLISSFLGAVLYGAVPAIMPFLTEKLAPEAYRQSLRALFEITQPGAVLAAPEFSAEVIPAVQQAGLEAGRQAVLLQPTQANPVSSLDFSTDGFLTGLSAGPQDLVLLQHSSGTTGLQKGVALSHQAVIHQLEHYTAALQLNARDVIVSWLPLYHDMGLIAGFLLPVLTRTPLVLMSPFDWVRAPYRLFQAISEYRGTLVWLPNFAYNFCAQKIRSRDLENVDLTSWRAVINCSEPIYWNSHQMFLERFEPYGLQPAALAVCYAMAENVFAVTQGGIDAPVVVDWIDRQIFLTAQRAVPAPAADDDHATLDGHAMPGGHAMPVVSSGKPLSNCQVKIVDPAGAELPDRQVGEIALRSNCLLEAYYHRPDSTKQAIKAGWYLTGDLGYLVAGELFVVGRKKDLIIVGGKNVYPQDIERLVNETPGVYPGRVVAFGVANPRSGTEDVVVIAETETAGTEARAQIAAEIRRRVTRGSDVALRFVQVVDRNWLLKTSSGKIARGANRERYLAEFGAAHT